MPDPNADLLAAFADLSARMDAQEAAQRAARQDEMAARVGPTWRPPTAPGVELGRDVALAGVNTAYSTSVALGAAGLFVTNGAITVTNPGSTVVIDGTSNMFKIVATGTLTCAYGGAPSVTGTSVTLSALGNYSVLPAFAANTAHEYADSASRGDAVTFDANTGLAGILRQGAFTRLGFTGTPPCQIRVTLEAWTWSVYVYAGTACRYAVFKEAGI